MVLEGRVPLDRLQDLLLYRCKIFFFIKGGDYKGMEGALSLEHGPMAENSTELAGELNELADKVLNNYY